MFDISLHSILEKTVCDRYRVNKQSKNLSPQLYLCAHIHSLVTFLWAGCHWLFCNIKQVINAIRWRHVHDIFFQLISSLCLYFIDKFKFLPANLHLFGDKCLILWFKQLWKWSYSPNFAQMTSTWINQKDTALLKPLSVLCEKCERIAVVYKPSVGLVNVYIKNDKMLHNSQLHNTHAPVAKPYTVHQNRSLISMNHLLGRTLKIQIRRTKLKSSYSQV